MTFYFRLKIVSIVTLTLSLLVFQFNSIKYFYTGNGSICETTLMLRSQCTMYLEINIILFYSTVLFCCKNDKEIKKKTGNKLILKRFLFPFAVQNSKKISQCLLKEKIKRAKQYYYFHNEFFCLLVNQRK